jgi:hypothetical protein
MVFSVPVFLLMLFGLEILSRQHQFNYIFPLRSLGSFHSQFEIKWFKLQDYVQANGAVDVILIGNSMVNTGIDPRILESEYETLTGQKLRIFNFGVEGLTVKTNSKIADILYEKYHPGTILVGTEMRDYVLANDVDVTAKFESNAWFKSQVEKRNTLESWLISNSSGLQRLLVLRNWSSFDFLDNFLVTIQRYYRTKASGYEPDLYVFNNPLFIKEDPTRGEEITKHPDPNDPSEKIYFDLFSNFKIDPSRLSDLKSILALHSRGVQVFVTEMPVYPTYFDYFGGESVHQKFLTDIKQSISENRGIFLDPVAWDLFPLEDRVDNHHLNYLGAPLYSQLLAQQLAEECFSHKQCMIPADDSSSLK